MKILKKFLDWVLFFLTGKGELSDELVRERLIDYSGQGRDAFGK